MIDPSTLSKYYGAKLYFQQDTVLHNQSGAPVAKIRKGQTLEINSAVVSLAEQGGLPAGSGKILLRKFTDMTDSEALELAELIFPKEYGSTFVRYVARQGLGRGLHSYTVEIFLSASEMLDHTLVINSRFDLALSAINKILKDEKGAPLVQQLAIFNQAKAQAWLTQKHFDTLNLIDRGLAMRKKPTKSKI